MAVNRRVRAFELVAAADTVSPRRVRTNWAASDTLPGGVSSPQRTHGVQPLSTSAAESI